MIISDVHGDVIRSFDGTLLATRCMGEGDRLPLLICNAIGANLAPWKRVLVDVERERRIVTWDHRGLLGSGPPASDRLDAGAHAEDALAALEHFGVEQFVVASWSNGTRIALEVADRNPDRVRGLVLVCGGFGHPLSRLLRYLELPSVFPLVAGVAKHFGASLQAPFRALVARPEIAGLISQSGMVGPTADNKLLIELLQGIATSDLRMLMAIYEAVAGDGGVELSAGIEAPTLVIAGERDPFTPNRLVGDMTASMRDARLEVYERATHYLPIEYPARLSDDMRRFFAALGV
ncbi:MAG: alpha/beta hydrolase [Actinomycetota bacterium]|nr:alpha/beta hydrolase [Actinomycetota bacterium]